MRNLLSLLSMYSNLMAKTLLLIKLCIDSPVFNHYLQESPPSKQSERWREMEEKSSDVISLQYE